MADPTYPPLDTLKPAAEGVWTVDSGPLHGVIPLRMTIVRLPDGGLLIHSPTRLTPALRDAADAMGPVRALVAPNTLHWLFVREWQQAYPLARVWGAPGLGNRRPVRKSGLTIQAELSDTAPPEWGGVFETAIVPGGFGFREAALFHRPTETLLLADLILNLEPARVPLLLRPFAVLAGMTAPHGRAPVYLRAVVKLGGTPARQAATRILSWQPQRVLFSHGLPITGDSLARSLAWLAR